MKLPGVHHVNGRKLGQLSTSIPPMTAQKGKGGGDALLPNRAAVHELLGGDPVQSALGNYAKATPTGANALGTPGFLPRP
jgi:hypothetical protein